MIHCDALRMFSDGTRPGSIVRKRPVLACKPIEILSTRPPSTEQISRDICNALIPSYLPSSFSSFPIYACLYIRSYYPPTNSRFTRFVCSTTKCTYNTCFVLFLERDVSSIYDYMPRIRHVSRNNDILTIFLLLTINPKFDVFDSMKFLSVFSSNEHSRKFTSKYISIQNLKSTFLNNKRTGFLSLSITKISLAVF